MLAEPPEPCGGRQRDQPLLGPGPEQAPPCADAVQGPLYGPHPNDQHHDRTSQLPVQASAQVDRGVLGARQLGHLAVPADHRDAVCLLLEVVEQVEERLSQRMHER